MVALRAFVLGGVYDVVSAYPRCPRAGFYRVKELYRQFYSLGSLAGLSNSWMRAPFMTFCVILT